MSKPKKNIEVEIKEQKDSKEQIYHEVVIAGQPVGTISENDGKFEIKNTNDHVYKVSNFDEGVQTLIKDFHLHR